MRRLTPLALLAVFAVACSRDLELPQTPARGKVLGSVVAATDAIRHPLKMFKVGRNGVKTDGPMAPDVDLSTARPAEDVYSSHVELELAKIKAADPEGFKRVQRAA